jgi:hypothetical protein
MSICPSDDRLKAYCHHAIRRAGRRYGLALTPEALAAIEARIRAGGPGCVRLRRDSYQEGRAVFAVELDGSWYPVVFDHRADAAVTFLPPAALDPYLPLLGPVAAGPPGDGPGRVAIPSTIREGPDPAPWPMPPAEVDLGDDPVPADDAGRRAWLAARCAPADVQVAALTAAARDLDSRMAGLKGAPAVAMGDRLRATAAARREWKAHAYRVRLAASARLADVGDPDDPRQHVRALTLALARIAARPGGGLEAEDRAAWLAAMDFLHRTGPPP